jgi:tryptophanyl-tRNA synthetase
LFFLLEQFNSDAQVVGRFRAAQKDGTIKYSELKTVLADSIADYFADFRKKKKELLADKQFLAQVLADGAGRARNIAHETLTEVKQKIGLL